MVGGNVVFKIQIQQAQQRSIVAKISMAVQWQVGTVDGQIGTQNSRVELFSWANKRHIISPKQPVMDEQQIHSICNGVCNGQGIGIDRGAQPQHFSAIGCLQAIVGRRIVWECGWG